MEQINKNDIPRKLTLTLTYLFTMNILATIIAIVSFIVLRSAYPNNPNNETFALTLTNLLCYAVMTFAFLFLIDKYYQEQFSSFKKKFIYFMGLAIGGWVLNIFLNIIIEMIMQIANFTSRDTQNQEAIVETFKFPLLAIPMVVIGAPIVEETIFRGVLFNFAKNRKLPYHLNIVLAFILSSSLFGLIHVFSAYLTTGDHTELILGIPYIAAGFVLTLLYYLTGNIFVPIVMHIIQNSFSVIAIMLFELLPQEPPMKIVNLLYMTLH